MGFEPLVELLGDEVTDPEEGTQLQSAPLQAYMTDMPLVRIVPSLFSDIAVSGSRLCRFEGDFVGADSRGKRFLDPSVPYNPILRQSRGNNGCR